MIQTAKNIGFHVGRRFPCCCFGFATSYRCVGLDICWCYLRFSIAAIYFPFLYLEGKEKFIEMQTFSLILSSLIALIFPYVIKFNCFNFRDNLCATYYISLNFFSPMHALRTTWHLCRLPHELVGVPNCSTPSIFLYYYFNYNLFTIRCNRP
jgi:hypothetical protein